MLECLQCFSCHVVGAGGFEVVHSLEWTNVRRGARELGVDQVPLPTVSNVKGMTNNEEEAKTMCNH
jgi:hypothetical protein